MTTGLDNSARFAAARQTENVMGDLSDWSPCIYLVSVDELLEYDVCGDDPNDGDQETPPDGHVCDVPSPEHDASQGLARERLWQAVRYVPE